MTITRQEIRDLFQQACFGAGADVRWEARDMLDRFASLAPTTTAAMLTIADCSVQTYFATKPISRPTRYP